MKYFFGEPIRIYQGDTRDYDIDIAQATPPIDISQINKVFFTSKGAGLQKECTLSDTDGVYRLHLSSDEIADKLSVITTYDITVELTDGSKQTAITEGEFAILKKRNPIG